MKKLFSTIPFYVLLSATVFAQTGPAGVGSSTNNIIWLDANDISQADNTDVTSWTDRSGNTVTFIDTGNGNPPSFQTGEVNGLPVLEFDDGNAEHLVISGYSNMAATEISTIIVFATANSGEALISYAVSGQSNEYLIFDASSIRTYLDGSNNAGGGFDDGAGTYNIFTSTWNSTGGALAHYKNSTVVNTATMEAGTTITNNGTLVIGGEQDSEDGGYQTSQDFGGSIAEIILYNTALNGGERIILENYLSEKYGITISEDYFGNYTDYTASYNDDIRGIGTENGTDTHATSGFSSGLQLEALDGLDNTDEFALFAHDASVSHADNITANISDPDITDRWQKDYFLEESQGGVVDAASLNVEFTFDFSEAGLTFTGSSTDYVLLYRATTSDDFTRVFASSYNLENGDQIVVDVPASRLRSGYYTLGRGTQLTSRTWYVLQNGNWADANIWTLDAGTAPIPDNDLNEVPGSEDEVIIRNGRTVTIQSATNNLTVAGITVDGTLDVTTSSGHDFNIIDGQGTIRMSGSGGTSNLPDGTTTNSNGFGHPSNGGLLLVEDALEFDQDRTFKDVRILTDDPADIVALGADLTINGDFNVRYGTLQFGDGTTTNRTFTVIGSFSVENNGGTQDGRVTTAVASNTRHEFDLYGDFLNEGTAQFSDRTAADFTSESTNGVVDLNLISTTQDQRIDCNGLTYFYRIEIVKNSIDFMANIQADDPGNFILTGYANANVNADVDEPTDNANAFGLITGTVGIGTNVSIRLNTTGNYSIGSDAKLVVDGGEVTKTGGAAITPYGILEISEGILEVPSGSGITTRDNGQIIVSGGEVWVSQIRTSIQGTAAQGGYEQTGGTVNVWDYSAAESPLLGVAAGSANAGYARFCLTYEGNAFTMTGGTLNVKDATTNGLIFINSDPSNINVSGGAVNAYSTLTTASTLAANVEFWDFNAIQESTGTIEVGTLTCGPGGADNRTITDPDLVVLSDVTIGTGAELVMNDNDLYIGEDLTIAENITGVTYQPGDNTTYFNGNLSGLITLNSTEADIADGRLDFNHVVLDKSSVELGVFCAYNLPNFNGNVIRVNGDMTVENGFWNQGDENLDLQGDNVTVKGTLGVYEPGVTVGLIVLRSSSFNLSTTDDAQFGYVRYNNVNSITMTSDVYIQRMWWRRGLWNLGTHNLRIDQLDIRPNTDTNGVDYVDEDGTTVCENCLSANYMFATDGNVSDGGLSLMIRSDGINPARYRSDNGDATQDIFDYRGNVVANTVGGSSTDNLYIFPVGIGYSGIDAEFGDPSATTTDDTAKYTPIYLDIQDVTGVTEDSVYVTIRPVDGELQTTDLSGGDVLSYYWSIEHAYTGTTPTVTIETDYYTDDLDGSTNESSFVAGEVEGGGSFNRSYEDDNIPESEGVDDTNNRLTFNGDADTGFSLVNANYTAGETGRFVGSPTIYYSRLPDNSSWYNREWDNGNYWSLVAHDGADNNDSRPAAGTFPQAGDIAVIGYGGFTGGISPRHSIIINDGDNIEAAEIIYDNNSGTANRLVVFGNASLTFGRISGNGGIFMERPDAGDAASISGDFGDFYSNPAFTYAYFLNTNGTYNITPPTMTFPNLRVEGGNSNRIAIFLSDIMVNNNMIVDGNTVVRTNNGAAGDIEVIGDLRIGGYLGGNFQFNDANARTVEVGRLWFRNQGTCNMTVLNTNPNGITHTLIVNEDILQQRPGDFDLFNGIGGTDNNVILELSGEGTHSYTQTDGNTPQFYQVNMNKGTDTTSSFTFPIAFDIPDATATFQPIEIVNGLLTLNNTGINSGSGILLANGSDFYLPNTLNSESSSGSGGLELAAGTASITGDDTGIILDGLLRISGGTLDMSDDAADNGNNFIEYGVSDQAIIDISAGSLLVGSHVRRPLSTNSGLLNYTQTGGIAQFGITAAPESIRGVFELTGFGSEFTHTSGDFIIVRENGSATVGSLIIKPDIGDLNVANSTITIGSADTPTNQNDIGIDSNVPLNNLLITGNNSPTAKIYNVQLEVADLTVQSGGTFDANGFDLTVNGDFANDGTYNNGGTDINQQTTIFPTTSAHLISGSGTSNFFNMQKNGSAVLTVGKNIEVNNNLSITAGTMSTGTSAVNVAGDMLNDAVHTCDPAGPGIVFNGTDAQNLDTSSGSGEFGVLTLDNANGLDISGDGKIFEVTEKVVLTTGVFNIGGNLLIMDEDAYFENGSGGQSRTDFNVNSMVSVNASITDNGVRKLYEDSFSGTYLYPVGLNFYTPAEVNVTDLSGSSGNDNQITIKPIEDIAGGIPDDSDEVCGSFTQDYVDVDNILQFYWSIRSANVEDFDGSIFLYHVDQLESVDNTEGLDLTNYAPARLLNASSTWDKGYSADQFDEVNNRIEFRLLGGADYTNFNSDDIAGTYTAGITVATNSSIPLCGGAIPDVVPEYITEATATSGDVDDIISYATAPGGTVPALGESPDLRVTGDFTLNLTDQFWRFRKVTIETGATLTVSGAGVNLGTVEGDGKLKLINVNTLPAGDYASFEADGTCTTGGTFELEVSSGNSVDLALPFTRLRRLIVSGDGEKVVTNGATFNICEDLEILNGGTLTMGDNTTFNIQGDLIKAATASFSGDFNNALIVMEGSSQQQIDGDFTGTNQIKSLEVDNSAGFTVLNTANDNVEVEQLIMTSGLITTDANNSLIILSTGDVTGNFSSTTFVDGPLVRRLETSTDRQFFPVGDGSIYLPFEVSNTSGYTGTKDWTVQYHAEDPTTSSLITNVSADFDFSTWGGETNTGNSVLFRQDLFEVEVPSPATADVRPYWDGDSDVGASQSEWEELRVMVWDNVGLEWDSYGNGNANYTGMSASGGSVVSDTDLSFSTNFVTLGANPIVPLPVELLDFSGVAENNEVTLAWSTASELNNDYFEVQRSGDGETFQPIGVVQGNGTTTDISHYAFVDRSPGQGVNYYRLRQVDHDGAEEIHPIIRVDNEFYQVAGVETSVYPNPASAENLNLRISTGDDYHPIRISIRSLSGKLYYKETHDAVLSMDMKIDFQTQIESGLYFIIVEQGTNISKRKLLIR